MSNLRHSAKRDANEPDIISAYEKMGCAVERLNGAGIPDLLVSFKGFQEVVEVKTKDGKLNKAQKEFRSKFGRLTVVRTVDEAIDHANQLRSTAKALYEAMARRSEA